MSTMTEKLMTRLRAAGVRPCAAAGAGILALLILWLNRRAIASAAKGAAVTIRNTMNNSYFTISELCASSTAAAKGIDNTPSETVKANLQKLITNTLDPLRSAYGKPIVVTSGYRCAKLNTAVGGVANSQHLTGQAADIRGEGNTKAELIAICKLALSQGNYDQLIFEHKGTALWLHISYNSTGNRHSFMTYNAGKYATLPSSGWESRV